MQSGSTEARLPSSSSPTCAQCRLRVGYVLVALRYLIEIRRERVISQAIVVQVFVEHSANWSEAAAEAFDHDCDYSPNALHAKKKTAFLTVPLHLRCPVGRAPSEPPFSFTVGRVLPMWLPDFSRSFQHSARRIGSWVALANAW